MRGATQRLRRSRISVLLICARTRDQDGSADGCRKILPPIPRAGVVAAFHEHRSVPDGIIYPSRLNGHTNLAIFDRAISKLSAVRVVPLIGAPGLATIINDLRVSLVDII